MSLWPWRRTERIVSAEGQDAIAAGRDITIYQGTPPEPAVDAQAAIATYLERVREVYRRLNLDVLGPSGLAGEQPVIELRQVYIPQDCDIHDARSPIDRDALRLHPMAAHGEDPPSVLRLIGESRELRLVVIGDPGGGKSTLTKFLALALADALETVPSELAPLMGLVPVVVELRQYAQQPERTIEEFLEFIHAQERMGLPSSVLGQLFADGDALVAFDGLDEIFDPELRSTVARRIAAFASAYPRVRTIVTSREYGYRASDFTSADFRHVKLRNLDAGQVAEFTRRWYTAAHPAAPARAEQLTERLLNAVKNIRAVGELAGNPLLLTVLAAIGLGHTIPRERRNVYAHAIEVLVERWDRDAKFLTPSGPANAEAAQALEWLNAGRRLKLLERIARRMQSDAGKPAGTFIHHDELTGIISGFLSEHNIGGPAAEIAADFLVERLRTRNFLLAHYGGGIYGFVHRTFLEYLASSDLVRRRDEEEWSRDEFVDLLNELSQDPTWHEVVLLTASRLKQRDVAAFLARLLKRHRRTFRQRRAPALLFAIRVLAEVEEISDQAGSRADDDRLSVSAQSDAAVDALTTALRRKPRLDADEALPALATFDHFWSGRQRYLRWYRAALSGSSTHGAATGILVARSLCRDDRSTRRTTSVRWHPLAYKFASQSGPDGPPRAAYPRSQELQAIAEGAPPLSEVIAAIQAGVDHPDADRRLDVLLLLADTWPDDTETARIVEAATQDADSHVRSLALQLIAGSWAASSSVSRALGGDTPIRLPGPRVVTNDQRGLLAVRAAATDDTDPSVRIEALQILLAVWPGHPDTHSTIEAASTDPDRSVRIEALRLITMLQAGHPDTHIALLAAATDHDGTVRVAALHLLSDNWPGHLDSWSAIHTATTDPDPAVRTEAVRLLADHWLDRLDTRAAVDTAAGDDNPAVRSEALQLLGEYWPNRSVAYTALADPAWEVRIAALQVLAARFTETALRPALELSRQDPSDEVRTVAVKLLALAWPEEPEAVATITALTADPSETIRTVAGEALSVLGVENPLA
ncbi:HEAT repeat domain-containing protein [Kitasatospora sp. NPDC051170]|uniref:HEAT repeat domain-containing protein n=1 Tax=Kitasatospora sp. NPDC051170 TaxID=3364056 RepID=UPI00378C8848